MKLLSKVLMFIILVCSFAIPSILVAQAPQKLNYQAVVFDSQNALVRNTAIGIRISVLHNSATGDIVFQETYSPSPVTNNDGVVTIEIGTGIASIGAFELIDWANGTYFIKSETDLSGGSNYSLTSTSQFLSTPYALYANKSGDGFSGNYNDLANKPVTDGSETKLSAGSKINITGTGTSDNPYVINSAVSTVPLNSKLVLTSSQTYTVPAGVSKIKVELWGGSGGGGGAGAYSYSFNLQDGGAGGGGGFSSQEYDVVAGQQFDISIGDGGSPGQNAVYFNGNYVGDVDGGNGGDSHFGAMKAAGGAGGKKGSYSWTIVNGSPGIDNIGTITAHPSYGGSNQLDTYIGIPRSYISDRLFTSKPGRGGSLSGYSEPLPTSGEAGCAIITFIE
ncbi:MAG: hypothetical protein HXX13_08195 [Bacteroidetes bacterium]|nr:hypothetical protein [Bacteroidota bacterium]